MAQTTKWWHSPFRAFQTNIREIDAPLDVDATLDHIESLGADVWLLNTAGIVSFYPSELPYQHPSEWLSERSSGDLVGDAIRRAHERGVKVIARVDLSKVHRDIAEAHPDWCFVSPGGEPQIYNGLYSTCPSTDYYQARSIDILGEILDRYEPDAFFFNMFKFKQTDYSGNYHGICQCTSCSARFRQRYGLALPLEHDFTDEAYLAWLEYTRETINEVSSTIREYVAQRRSACAVLLKEVSDVTFREANNAVDRPQPIWIHWAGELVQDVLGSQPDKPMLVNNVMFLDIPYRFMAEQPNFHALHLLQTIAYGANPMAYMIGLPELFAPAAFDHVREIFHFHRDHEEFYRDVRSAARIGLLSSQTRDEFYGEATRATRGQTERRGVHQALLEAHIPFDIISEDYLRGSAAQQLMERFDAIVVPDYPDLGATECALLDAYVAAGGGLVVTYETATNTADGERSDQFGLQSLGASRILARRRGRDVRSSYLLPVEDRVSFNLTNNRFIALDQAFDIVEPRADAEAPLRFLPASTYGPPEKCYWEFETDHPGAVVRNFGKGRTLFFPWPIGTLFHDLSIPEYRDLLAQAISDVSGAPPQVESNLPEQVEIIIGRQQGAGRTLIHLINYTGHDGRAFHRPIEIHDIRLRLRGTGAVALVRSSRLGEDLTSEREPDGSMTVVLPRLGLFDLIILEEGDSGQAG